MCFSATASFGAGVILTATGIITRSKIKLPHQEAFAAIPFIFAAQQFAEGFLWLSLTHPDFAGWHQSSMYLFLVFAQVVWPLWVPWSILKLEDNPGRIRILRGFVWLGSLVSGYLAYCLYNYPVQADVTGYHIHYTLYFPLALTPLSGIVYFIPTVGSPFFSSNKRMPVLGLAILGSYIFTKMYYKEHVISVWCFLAAVLSVLVYAVLAADKERQRSDLHTSVVADKNHPAR